MTRLRGALALLVWLSASITAAAQDITDTPEARAALAALEARHTPDALAVTRAIGARLRGLDVPAGDYRVGMGDATLLDGLAGDLGGDPPWLIDGFSLLGLGISAADPAARMLRGVIAFTDSYRRRRMIEFTADYRLEGKAIIVNRVLAEPVYASLPAVVTLFVPRRDFPDDFWLRESSLDSLLALANERAISFAMPWQIPTDPDTYLVFAFFFDAVDPLASVGLRIADEAEGPAGDTSRTAVLRQGPWRVAIAEARFGFAAEPSIYFKATHSPAAAAGEQRQTLLAGVFSNRLPDPNDDVVLIAPTAPPQPAPAQPVAKPAEDDGDFVIRLQRLRRLLDEGLITEEEYKIKRQRIIDEL
jgi:hypothetical protein